MRFGSWRAIAAAACALAIAAPALAQWAWKDDNGRMVYSDRPPPAGIKQGNIIRSPTVVTAPPAAAPTGTAPGAAGAPAEAGTAAAPNAGQEPGAKPGPKSLADQEADFRKRLQARAAAEKKAADDEAKASKDAQDCERAKGYVHSLESGMRINRVDADGNPHFLDDSERAAELDRARASAATVCH